MYDNLLFRIVGLSLLRTATDMLSFHAPFLLKAAQDFDCEA